MESETTDRQVLMSITTGQSHSFYLVYFRQLMAMHEIFNPSCSIVIVQPLANRFNSTTRGHFTQRRQLAEDTKKRKTKQTHTERKPNYLFK